jgi:hypothetical protein
VVATARSMKPSRDDDILVVSDAELVALNVKPAEFHG